MSDVETRYHEAWIGMVQPIEGLVVSIPVLVEAQCINRQPPSFQQAFLEVCPADGAGHRIGELGAFLETVLGWTPDLYDRGDALPDDLSLYVPEGKQTLRPTLALRRQVGQEIPLPQGGVARSAGVGQDNTLPQGGVARSAGVGQENPLPQGGVARSAGVGQENPLPQGGVARSAGVGSETPAAQAGAAYVALLWQVPDGLDLDKSETLTGPWDYPAAAKFDRLLRQCRVPIGLLTNGREVRLFYAPHGESSGVIRFRIDDMASVGGRPILDAFAMLLSAHRFFGALPERQLPALLAESRKRQVNVTNELADQVFEALQILLRGFEAAGERDRKYAALLHDAQERGDDYLFGGLLTVLLRLVFVLYAEDRGLLPVENPIYAEGLSLLGLFDQLQQDHGAYPDSMSRRLGAWPRLVALFRAIFLGVEHGDLRMPQRRGELFDPHLYPFLEGWGPEGGAPIGGAQAVERAAVGVPAVDDETVFRVLQKLLILEGQRLSYRALDVEQIGSVYEALMGYHVRRVEDPCVCLKPEKAKAVWVSAADALAVAKGQRAKWFKEEVGLAKGAAEKIAAALAEVTDEADGLRVLEGFRVKGTHTAPVGSLVIQPGSERKRTSSHYTPRSLSAPIVEKTLAPLIKVMGDAPSSDRLLNLKVCDPAMGSGAFLVEACRWLADQLVAAWTREQRLDKVADEHEDVVNHARRLVAQRCLYGGDKNRFAVNLAKLSLWLVTLATDEPFTFVDHALRHGDSLVGLDFEQIRSFHWAPTKQLETCRKTLDAALAEAILLRQRILDLAASSDAAATNEKHRLLRDAEDALDPVRLIGDLVVGAFFSANSDKERQRERDRRLVMVEEWLATGGAPPAELRDLQRNIHARLPVYHWMTEFPEVFYAERPDPLDQDQVNRAAFMDAFVGNPPFAGKNGIVETGGEGYTDWLMAIRPEVRGRPNTDLCAYFYRRSAELLGRHGVVGFIATNTIAQGDSRLMALKLLVDTGASIFDAQTGFPWPGSAAVVVSTVHLALGSVAQVTTEKRLDGVLVNAIDSRLRPRIERPEPVALSANANLAFMGGKLVGIGLAMNSTERDAYVNSDPRNERVLRPFIGGEEVNQSTASAYQRYMIDFSAHTLEEAAQWPELLRVVEAKVKPARMRDKRGTYKTYWWRPGESGAALYTALRGQQRCLVAANVTKHLMFSFHPTTPFFAQTLYVFALEGNSSFAILQSRVHEAWARLLSSSMKTDLRYTASDCFDTFAFPKLDPRTSFPALEDIGASLHSTRAMYVRDVGRGLTSTYNLIKDPDCMEAGILQLRDLHIEMDRAVLAAYGWDDIPVPPYTTPTTPEEERALEAFQDEVIDRLFVLNVERAKQEQLAGLSAKKSKGKATRRKATPGQPSLLPEESE